MLVEIQGQFEGRGLMDVATHIRWIVQQITMTCWQNCTQAGKIRLQAQRNLAHAKRELEKARAEEEWLRDAVEQLDLLAPKPGEEEESSAERERLSNVGRIGESLAIADDAIFGDSGAQSIIGRALSALEKVAPQAGGLLDSAQQALVRADAELAEAAPRSAAQDMRWKVTQHG